MIYNEIIKNVSSNLKRLRKEKNLTQENLIKLIGEENLSLRSYKTYESGKSSKVPLLEKLVLISKFYGVSLDELVFSRKSTYDDSFSKRDCLKRITSLMHSMTLKPIKENNSNNQFYGKYYFLSLDDDVTLLVDKIEASSLERKLNFNFENINNDSIIEMYNKAINEIPNLDDDWFPTFDRLKYLLTMSNMDADKYIEENLKKLNSISKGMKIKKSIKKVE